MTEPSQLLYDTERYVEDYFNRNVQPQFVFHNLEHTVQTVAASRTIGEGFRLPEQEMTLLLLATWFHDTGYAAGPEDHEERSCRFAEAFLQDKLSAQDIATVTACIRSTKVPQRPESLLEQIICDADLSHLGMETYWERNSRLRQEFNLTRGILMNDQEWVDFELNFMLNHEYHTTVARELFDKRKAKHIQQLVKQKHRLNPQMPLSEEERALIEQKGKEKDVVGKVLKETETELKLSRFGRGVETMYRTTYRTHTNLSQMADSKANLMLSVNAIVISILISNLLPKLNSENTELVLPTIMLTATCLGSMIFATLSTRPKVTEGKVTKEAIKERKANLLFFGNFYNMPLDDFQWGVNEMLKDPDFLYSSMSRDLYFLGKVLAQKYKYLSICYNIFMYGLIISVLAFGISYLAK
jgi:predicted metal-dependent HD superfamily phosphohydrolase